MSSDLRMHWEGDATGWVLDSAKGLTPWELDRAIKHTIGVQADRLVSLPPGDRKDECERTIAALRARRVSVNIAGAGERVLFDAYQSEGRKVFDFGGAR